MENPKKTKLPMIITGILFAISLVVLIVLVVLQLGSKNVKGKTDNDPGSAVSETDEGGALKSPKEGTDSGNMEETETVEMPASGNDNTENGNGFPDPGEQPNGTNKGTDETSEDNAAGKPGNPLVFDGSGTGSSDGSQGGEGSGKISDQEVSLTLEEELKALISDYDSDWAIYVKNLVTGDSFSLYNHEENGPAMKAASLIKLFIMGAVYQQIEDGILEETEAVDNYLNLMITVSDNTSANALVKLLSGSSNNAADGMAVVNKWATDHGYSNTHQGRELEDSREYGDNFTSVEDCGKILEDIYNGDCVSKASSKKMEQLLCEQTVTDKIPAGLPRDKNIRCGNKTGELPAPDNVENDVAIVYSPGNHYILCIMTQDLKDIGFARSSIVSISEMVYEYFNPLPQSDNPTGL